MDPMGVLHSHAFSIHIDGGNRGNPRPYVAAWIIHDSLGEIIVSASLYIPSSTNNQAKYITLVGALSDISSLQLDHIVIFTDSLLLTHQLNQLWTIYNPDLHQYAFVARSLMENFWDIQIHHIPRS
eukprot:Gb_07605 [translate_table: standard]